jgi:hypothetical protein
MTRHAGLSARLWRVQLTVDFLFQYDRVGTACCNAMKFPAVGATTPDLTVARFQMVPRSTHPPPHLEVETANPHKAIRFSSPKPWILATVLSLGLWAMLGWIIWCLFR